MARDGWRLRPTGPWEGRPRRLCGVAINATATGTMTATTGALPPGRTRRPKHHGLVAQTEPVDTFADAVSRRSDAEVDLGPIGQLLLAIERAGIVDSRQGVLLHTADLRRKR